jgi:hypothetical protein
MMVRPTLEEIKLALTWPTRKHMTSALQNYAPIFIKADATIGTIDLLFNHQ